jgi:hypothetical protein
MTVGNGGTGVAEDNGVAGAGAAGAPANWSIADGETLA